MDLILNKGSFTNMDHYMFMVKVGDIWYECDNVKITRIEFNQILFISYVIKEACDGNI